MLQRMLLYTKEWHMEMKGKYSSDESGADQNHEPKSRKFALCLWFRDTWATYLKKKKKNAVDMTVWHPHYLDNKAIFTVQSERPQGGKTLEIILWLTHNAFYRLYHFCVKVFTSPQIDDVCIVHFYSTLSYYVCSNITVYCESAVGEKVWWCLDRNLQQTGMEDWLDLFSNLLLQGFPRSLKKSKQCLKF